MDISDYLTNLYINANNLTKTNLGLSNDIYTFELDNTKYCLRHSTNPAVSNENLLLERKIQEVVKKYGFDFKEKYYDSKNSIRITYFIDNLKTLKEENDINKYKKAIDRIKQFHTIDIETNLSFDLVSRYHDYLERINNGLIDYTKYEKILTEYSNLNCKIVLSHNDLVDGNVCFDKGNCLLIDYEFASLNYELFDLVSLLSENRIYEKTTRDEIIDYYFNSKQTKKELNEIRIIEEAQDLLWAAWANMMYEKNNNKDYLSIFKDKISSLNNNYL